MPANAMRRSEGGVRIRSSSTSRLADVNQEKGVELVALDDALTSLSEIDPELSRLVELRFFGGLTVRETAVVLGVSPATVKRSWRTAKIWLHRELNRS